MPYLLSNIRIDVSNTIYLKDPYSSDLGKQIVAKALSVLEDVGMEKFTFKKVALEIGSTESAIYRYFEGKHKLLLYYVSWYWGWLEYNLAFGTANINDPKQRLEVAIRIITRNLLEVNNAPFDLEMLQSVIISESSKAFFTKEVDDENKGGMFVQFKSLCKRLSTMITEVAPEFPYSNTLASTFIESHIDQLFFKAHLPSLSDFGNDDEARFEFYKTMIFSTIGKWTK